MAPFNALSYVDRANSERNNNTTITVTEEHSIGNFQTAFAFLALLRQDIRNG